jgi:hypothetical protein
VIVGVIFVLGLLRSEDLVLMFLTAVLIVVAGWLRCAIASIMLQHNNPLWSSLFPAYNAGDL